MALVEPVVAQIILNSLMSRPSRLIDSRRKTEWFLLGLSVLLAALGVVYLCIGAHAALAERLPPAEAGAVTGLAALALGGISALIALTIGARRQAHIKNHALEGAGASVLAALDAATQGLEEPIAENPRTSMALASLAGFLAADKFH